MDILASEKEQIIDKAFIFASEKHKNQFRKGTKIPYIVHLYEVYNFLREENADLDTIVAGILHDTIEDTDATYQEINDLFGSNVANIVNSESEDKKLPYRERKALHMNHLKNCDENIKLINCADKLSNLRSIYLDIKYFSDSIFNRFNGSKEDIKFYYALALDALESLKERNIYKSLKIYFNLVFGN